MMILLALVFCVGNVFGGGIPQIQKFELGSVCNGSPTAVNWTQSCYYAGTTLYQYTFYHGCVVGSCPTSVEITSSLQISSMGTESCTGSVVSNTASMVCAMSSNTYSEGVQCSGSNVLITNYATAKCSGTVTGTRTFVNGEAMYFPGYFFDSQTLINSIQCSNGNVILVSGSTSCSSSTTSSVGSQICLSDMTANDYQINCPQKTSKPTTYKPSMSPVITSKPSSSPTTSPTVLLTKAPTTSPVIANVGITHDNNTNSTASPISSHGRKSSFISKSIYTLIFAWNLFLAVF